MNQDEQIQEEFDTLNQGLNLNQPADPSFKFPTSSVEATPLSALSREELINSNWNKYFYQMSFFESIDGWGLVDSSASLSGVTYTGVVLTTGAVADDNSSIGKQPVYQDILSYDKATKFRTAFQISSVASVEFFCGIGVGGNGAVGNHIGFQVVNATLKGVVGNGSAQTAITLIGTIDTSTAYLCEFRLLPGKKVVFYVKKFTDGLFNELGTIATPSALPQDVYTNWIMYDIVTKTTAAKSVNFSFYEFLQEK